MKENADREINELKLQLKMVEESRDAVRRDFIEAQRKIRESEEGREMGRKEISELRRMLKDEEKEKEAIQFTTNELRSKVKKSEGGFYSDLNRGPRILINFPNPASSKVLLRPNFFRM